jgi:hypothetical protein
VVAACPPEQVVALGTPTGVALAAVLARTGVQQMPDPF